MPYLHITDRGPRSIQVVKTLREVLGVGLKEAKECVIDGIPLEFSSMGREARQHLRDNLLRAGVLKYEIRSKRNPAVAVVKSEPGKTWHERLLQDD